MKELVMCRVKDRIEIYKMIFSREIQQFSDDGIFGAKYIESDCLARRYTEVQGMYRSGSLTLKYPLSVCSFR